jgi:SusD family.
MKKLSIIFLLSTLLYSCNDLDLAPLAEGSVETWYSTEEEILMSIYDLNKDAFFPLGLNIDGPDGWTDDWMYRETMSPITSGTITGEWGIANTNYWLNSYKAITRCNTLIINLGRAADKIAATTLLQYEAEVRFIRACQYSRLISLFGDVVYYTDPLTIDEAFTMGRVSKSEVLKSIYEDFDFAAANAPLEYTGSAIKKSTKGTALGMKARIALFEGDFETAKNAAKACMDLGVYKLHDDFSSLFLSEAKYSKEFIFAQPRSVELKITVGIQDFIPRNAGGWAAWAPTWDLFCAFLCTDGLPIDESPLFDPREPFKNRDPRCAATIVEFNTPFLGFMYEPHPDSLTVMNFSTGRKQTNNDTRANAQFASFTGLLWKKWVEDSWLQNSWQAAPTKMILRYADVLLMYAEAKVKLGEIDQSVLDAINSVRARAYGVDKSEVNNYPPVTTTDSKTLMRIIMTERRMEFAYEGIRYMDIIRWRLAEKVLNRPVYGMLDPAALRENVVNKGLWFFPEVPEIDEDGIADFTSMYQKGLIKLITQRQFDKNRQYLWPIPSKDIIINDNIKQNPGY